MLSDIPADPLAVLQFLELPLEEVKSLIFTVHCRYGMSTEVPAHNQTRVWLQAQGLQHDTTQGCVNR